LKNQKTAETGMGTGVEKRAGKKSKKDKKKR